MSASVSHHLGQYVSGFKDRNNHPHDMDPVYLCFFHSLSTLNLLARPNVLYAVSNQNVILLSNVNHELEISKSFLTEHHQCLNTFTQDNTLKLENFRFYIFDLLLFLLGHYLAR